MVKPKTWTQLSQEGIQSDIDVMKAELFNLKCEYKFAKKLEKPHRLRALRRDIARALTEIQARHTPTIHTQNDQV